MAARHTSCRSESSNKSLVVSPITLIHKYFPPDCLHQEIDIFWGLPRWLQLQMNSRLLLKTMQSNWHIISTGRSSCSHRYTVFRKEKRRGESCYFLFCEGNKNIARFANAVTSAFISLSDICIDGVSSVKSQVTKTFTNLKTFKEPETFQQSENWNWKIYQILEMGPSVKLVSPTFGLPSKTYRLNKLAKLRRHASRVHFAKIQFGEIQK